MSKPQHHNFFGLHGYIDCDGSVEIVEFKHPILGSFTYICANTTKFHNKCALEISSNQVVNPLMSVSDSGESSSESDDDYICVPCKESTIQAALFCTYIADNAKCINCRCKLMNKNVLIVCPGMSSDKT